MASQHPINFWSGLSELHGHLSPARKRQFRAVVVLMLLGALAELATVGAIISFLSLLAGENPAAHLSWLTDLFAWAGARTGDRLAASAAALVLLVLATALIRLRLTWLSQSFIFGLGHDVSVDIQHRLLLQPYSFHLQRNSSSLVAALEKVQGLVGVLLHLLQAGIAAFISLFLIAGLIYFDPFTAIVAGTAFTLIYLVISAFSRKQLARNSEIIGTAYDERVKIVQESLDGIRDVIIDGSQGIYLDAFRKADRGFAQAHANTAFVGAAPRFIIEALGLVLIAMLALFMAQREGTLAEALPILGALAFGAQRLLPLQQQIYNGWSVASGHLSLLAQVVELLRLPTAQRRDRTLPPLPFTERIAIDRLSFAYSGEDQAVLRDISLEIPRGARVALVGRTGSGKSTLADLLMGLIEPTSGRILVDGAPLTGENRHRWQQGIAHVPQAIFIVDTSIARNIALSGDPDAMDMERVIEAARLAQLHDFVASLPDAYDTRAGQRGVRLSGGQKQRLGLARAIYKQAPVLVLDEATSALDDATEAAILRTLDRLREDGRTVIMIAHRRSTIAGCDFVVRLDDGRLVSSGSAPA